MAACTLAVLLAAILIVAGFFGQAHPALDSLANFRMHFAAAAILAALPLLLARGWRVVGMLAIALSAVAIVATTGIPWDSDAGVRRAAARAISAPGARYRLLQLNLRFDNAYPEKVLSLIGRIQPDVITLDEVSDRWRPKLALLKQRYPYSRICMRPRSYIGGVAILSRRPFAAKEPICADTGALAMASVDFGGRIVDIAALHLDWPWPRHQYRQVGDMSGDLSRLADTAILAGDLNATSWSETAKRVAGFGRLREPVWLGPTWLHARLPDILRPWIGLPIDHVFVKGAVFSLRVERLESAGSDHLPVVMDFMLLPEEKPAEIRRALLAKDSR